MKLMQTMKIVTMKAWSVLVGHGIPPSQEQGRCHHEGM